MFQNENHLLLLVRHGVGSDAPNITVLFGVGAASYLAVPTAARLLASSVETAAWNGALKSTGSDHWATARNGAFLTCQRVAAHARNERTRQFASQASLVSRRELRRQEQESRIFNRAVVVFGKGHASSLQAVQGY